MKRYGDRDLTLSEARHIKDVKGLNAKQRAQVERAQWRRAGAYDLIDTQGRASFLSPVENVVAKIKDVKWKPLRSEQEIAWLLKIAGDEKQIHSLLNDVPVGIYDQFNTGWKTVKQLCGQLLSQWDNIFAERTDPLKYLYELQPATVLAGKLSTECKQLTDLVISFAKSSFWSLEHQKKLLVEWITTLPQDAQKSTLVKMANSVQMPLSQLSTAQEKTDYIDLLKDVRAAVETWKSKLDGKINQGKRKLEQLIQDAHEKPCETNLSQICSYPFATLLMAAIGYVELPGPAEDDQKNQFVLTARFRAVVTTYMGATALTGPATFANDKTLLLNYLARSPDDLTLETMGRISSRYLWLQLFTFIGPSITKPSQQPDNVNPVNHRMIFMLMAWFTLFSSLYLRSTIRIFNEPAAPALPLVPSPPAAGGGGLSLATLGGAMVPVIGGGATVDDASRIVPGGFG